MCMCVGEWELLHKIMLKFGNPKFHKYSTYRNIWKMHFMYIRVWWILSCCYLFKRKIVHTIYLLKSSVAWKNSPQLIFYIIKLLLLNHVWSIIGIWNSLNAAISSVCCYSIENASDIWVFFWASLKRKIQTCY